MLSLLYITFDPQSSPLPPPPARPIDNNTCDFVRRGLWVVVFITRDKSRGTRHQHTSYRHTITLSHMHTYMHYVKCTIYNMYY